MPKTVIEKSQSPSPDVTVFSVSGTLGFHEKDTLAKLFEECKKRNLTRVVMDVSELTSLGGGCAKIFRAVAASSRASGISGLSGILSVGADELTWVADPSRASSTVSTGAPPADSAAGASAVLSDFAGFASGAGAVPPDRRIWTVSSTDSPTTSPLSSLRNLRTVALAPAIPIVKVPASASERMILAHPPPSEVKPAMSNTTRSSSRFLHSSNSLTNVPFSWNPRVPETLKTVTSGEGDFDFSITVFGMCTPGLRRFGGWSYG